MVCQVNWMYVCVLSYLSCNPHTLRFSLVCISLTLSRFLHTEYTFYTYQRFLRWSKSPTGIFYTVYYLWKNICVSCIVRAGTSYTLYIGPWLGDEMYLVHIIHIACPNCPCICLLWRTLSYIQYKDYRHYHRHLKHWWHNAALDICLYSDYRHVGTEDR